MTVHTTIAAEHPNQPRVMQRLALAVTALLLALFVAPSHALANDYGTYSVKVATGYLALRTAPSYDERNEIGELYTGDVVQVQDKSNGQYWWVYSAKLGKSGYVNADYLRATSSTPAPATNYGTYSVKVATGYLALRTAPSYDERNEIGELYTGDVVQVQNKSNGQYWWVYSPKLGKSGYVNADYLVSTGQSYGYVLTGVVHTHQESVYGGQVTVVSMTLDTAVSYTYNYKGIVSATAREVALASSASGDFEQWKCYDGRRISVACDSLHEAIHDSSFLGVDAFVVGDIRLLS